MPDVLIADAMRGTAPFLQGREIILAVMTLGAGYFCEETDTLGTTYRTAADWLRTHDGEHVARLIRFDLDALHGPPFARLHKLSLAQDTASRAPAARPRRIRRTSLDPERHASCVGLATCRETPPAREISWRLAFCHPRAFCRAYRRCTGTSPRASVGRRAPRGAAQARALADGPCD